MEKQISNRIYLNNEWLFTEQFTEELLMPECRTNALTQVRLPHTCKETPFHYFDESIYQMVSGYRKSLFASKEWQGKKVLLTLDGVAHASEVFCNGEKVGEHHCGYTAYTVDLSNYLNYDAENILVVKVDSRESLNIPPFGYVIDYMTYGGIYRDVYLDIKNPIYLEDVFVHTDLKGNYTTPKPEVCSEITLGGEVLNTSWTALTIKQRLIKKEAVSIVREQKTPAAEVLQEFTKEISRENAIPSLNLSFVTNQTVELWDTEHPHLYELVTELYQGEAFLDTYTVTMGFRDAKFKTDGFYLNGQKLKIRGLNRHQCYPYVGYAMPKSMQELDAEILKKELGVNAVRTSHYPQSHYFLDKCDELGLLVFTEIPGWQHIGNEEWKNQAVENVKDMIKQYRNHTSIILWGVRINESADDDEFYKRTNEAAHQMDPYRQTGGVRALKKSHLFEDVYTYNDFVHDGKHPGCEKKKAITSNMEKPYLVSEYNGHMFPTKVFDCEEHRLEHALRHANVLDAIAGEEDIAGSFGWCMFDYNTHKDFGSGDHVCYHGVMDMFRNSKMAAAIYACQQDATPVLELSSSMDIGEHPGCNRGTTWLFTNADSVRMYKNDYFIKEYVTTDSPYKNMKRGPIVIDDFIGNMIAEQENFKPAHAKEITDALNVVAKYGIGNAPKKVYFTILKMLLLYRMNFSDAITLYTKYVGDWGGESTSYRFEAIKNGKVVKTLIKEPMKALHMKALADHTNLQESNTYDVALVRIQALDEHENILSFYQEPVMLSVEGDIELIGPKLISLQGGMGGTYVKSKGKSGAGTLIIKASQMEEYRIPFTVTTKKTV
ncbi:MAG: glycoside hydrolase family 2 protein [Lachnospiraceae bacterium]|nr:glycoside hydrolase family 2 protein [Lachnospiraceae bacterium]